LIEKRIIGVMLAALLLAASAGYAQEPKELTVFTAASLTGGLHRDRTDVQE